MKVASPVKGFMESENSDPAADANYKGWRSRPKEMRNPLGPGIVISTRKALRHLGKKRKKESKYKMRHTRQFQLGSRILKGRDY